MRQDFSVAPVVGDGAKVGAGTRYESDVFEVELWPWTLVQLVADGNRLILHRSLYGCTRKTLRLSQQHSKASP